jgi:hypothetical protein
MEWTGRTLRYRLEAGATAIGDFNFIDATRALVIERDNGEGDPGLACAQGARPTPQQPCFPLPARFKRVYLVDLAQADAEGFVRKIGHIDLMAIRDPDGRARIKGDLPANAPRDRFTFPFFTIENVAAVDGDHIIVGNDNNLPFSAGRQFFHADTNEFILLRDIIRDYTPESYDYEPEDGTPRAKKGDYDLVTVIPVSDPNASTMAQKVVQ